MDLNFDRILSEGDLVGAFAIVATGSLGTGKYVIFGDDAISRTDFGKQQSNTGR